MSEASNSVFNILFDSWFEFPELLMRPYFLYQENMEPKIVMESTKTNSWKIVYSPKKDPGKCTVHIHKGKMTVKLSKSVYRDKFVEKFKIDVAKFINELIEYYE